MNEPPFKTGNIVLCVKPEDGDERLIYGKTYVVKDVWNNGGDYLTHVDNITFGFWAHRFILEKSLMAMMDDTRSYLDGLHETQSQYPYTCAAANAGAVDGHRQRKDRAA